MREAASLLRLLGDEGRLRLLRLLHRERLNVSELTAILGIAQSGVSRHLGLLKDAGLVHEQREAGYTYYRPPRPEENGVPPALRAALHDQFDRAADPVVRADDARLQEVLRHRKENFDAHGSAERQLVPGRSWAAWARALGHVLPPLVVADLGCGEGYLTIEAARWAREVVAVDRSADVLRRAGALAARRRVSNIRWKRGELEHLPIRAGTIDLALLSQALHHAADPAQAVGEAVRILVPGGRLLVLDLRAHDQQWVRERLGDVWLGFGDRQLRRVLEDAGLIDVRVQVGARKTGDPFAVLIASGRKPPESRRARAPRPKPRTRPQSSSAAPRSRQQSARTS